jgi:chromate reductase, NAD(P)H dehydrogenase (quinone)
MITIISGTNRPNSKTLLFAKQFHEIFQSKTDDVVHLLNLEDLPANIINDTMYAASGQSKTLAKIQDKMIVPATKFYIISPEYNGSFPGILKLFIDACSVREYKGSFKGKKAGLVGIADGRAGNLRGMDHLTGVLHHVGTTVMPTTLPISSLRTLLTPEGKINDATLKAMEAHVELFLNN